MNRKQIIITILISVAGLSLAAAQTPRRRTPAKAAGNETAPADNSAAKTLPRPFSLRRLNLPR